jgi:hypothetical protein
LVGLPTDPTDDTADAQPTVSSFFPPMTEADWLDCDNPGWMLDFIQERASGRKLRLYVCACVRRIWHVLWDERSKRSVEVAEQYADGRVGEQELASAHSASAVNEISGSAVKGLYLDPMLQNVAAAAYSVSENHITIEWAVDISSRSANGNPDNTDVAEYIGQCRLLVDILGNPFRSVGITPAWMTPAVLKLAQAAYDNRLLPSGLLDNAGLAVLADALEEAGCKKADILSHLRGAGPHVRGCWVLDFILGKE